ncbi:hypothetical protein MRB53_002956 [Persea americana]|uniref:Uncharacterized protein n=1 Tax=Persea americana TaxID=3435 RepID=A0ACC2MWX6_PERAE|nr:hypothetical protein MRB53_002956 [Persea americana]
MSVGLSQKGKKKKNWEKKKRKRVDWLRFRAWEIMENYADSLCDAYASDIPYSILRGTSDLKGIGMLASEVAAFVDG